MDADRAGFERAIQGTLDCEPPLERVEAAAARHHAESERLYRKERDPAGSAYTLTGQARVVHARGHHDDCQRLLNEALESAAASHAGPPVVEHVLAFWRAISPDILPEIGAIEDGGDAMLGDDAPAAT